MNKMGLLEPLRATRWASSAAAFCNSGTEALQHKKLYSILLQHFSIAESQKFCKTILGHKRPKNYRVCKRKFALLIFALFPELKLISKWLKKLAKSSTVFETESERQSKIYGFCLNTLYFEIKP